MFLAIISHDSAKICMGTPNFFLLILISIIFSSQVNFFIIFYLVVFCYLRETVKISIRSSDFRCFSCI